MNRQPANLEPYEVGIGSRVPDNLYPFGLNPNGCETPVYLSPQAHAALAPPLEIPGQAGEPEPIDFTKLDAEIGAESRISDDLDYFTLSSVCIGLMSAGLTAAEIRDAIRYEPTPARLAWAIGAATLSGTAAYAVQRLRRKDRALYAFQTGQE